MIFLADENIALAIVLRLRQDGHTVHFIIEGVRGIGDEDVLSLANHYQAILITDDKDFGDLVIFQHRPALGVILIRLEGVAPDERASIVSSVIQQHVNELAHSFIVIARNTTRIRKLVL